MHLGADVVSFDQEIGGGQATPCYDTNHTHGPGYGQYMWTGFEGLLKQVRADAAAAGTKLGLSTEQTSELSIPYMGTYWCGPDRPPPYCSGAVAFSLRLGWPAISW